MGTVNFLNKTAVLRASDIAEVSIQNLVRLNRYTEPGPDVVLLRADRDLSKVPESEDVLLLVEVADSTLRMDKKVKLPRYAAAGISKCGSSTSMTAASSSTPIHRRRATNPPGF